MLHFVNIVDRPQILGLIAVERQRKNKAVQMIGVNKNEYHNAARCLYLPLFSETGFNVILPLLQAKTLHLISSFSLH